MDEIAIAIAKKNKPTQEQVTTAVDAWLDDHPEATTTVEDGAITKAKLDSDLQDTVDDVADLKSAINSSPKTKNTTASDIDLDITDSEGNVILRLDGGHIKSRNFDSRNIAPTENVYEDDVEVTVGANGDYSTLNEALAEITKKYPFYASGGIEVNINILSGTTINEQIAVQKADFSYVTIIAEDEFVPVNVDGFSAQGLDTHDLRSPNVGAFIGGENAAGLPCIGCVFKVTQNTNSIAVVGYFANRSSKGVVLADSGFDGFYDGCISNNESSITIREGIAKNMTRWGVHARHNGEVSARSAILTGCEIGGYADRVANLDIRESDCSYCKTAAMACHASQICAAGAHCTGGGLGASVSLIRSESGSVVDVCEMEIVDPDLSGKIFYVANGGFITACTMLGFSNRNKCDVFRCTRNTLFSTYGIITADSDLTSHTLTISTTPADATITVKKSSSSTKAISPDSGETNKFTLLDGTYYVTVSADGYTTSSQNVTLSADQTLTVELVAE